MQLARTRQAVWECGELGWRACWVCFLLEVGSVKGLLEAQGAREQEPRDRTLNGDLFN